MIRLEAWKITTESFAGQPKVAQAGLLKEPDEHSVKFWNSGVYLFRCRQTC